MISDAQIWEYIKSDLPFDDLTTSLQGEFLNLQATLNIITRDDIVLSNVDIAAKIAAMLGLSPYTHLRAHET